MASLRDIRARLLADRPHLTDDDIADIVRAVRAASGQRGGASGRGPSKARSSEQARAAVQARWDKAKRAKKRKTSKPNARQSLCWTMPASSRWTSRARLNASTPTTRRGLSVMAANSRSSNAGGEA